MSLMTNLLFFLDASIIFVKSVLWNNIGKVHDVISAIPRLTALLTQRKNLLHELKRKTKKRLQQARTPMKINKIVLQNYLFLQFCNNNINNFNEL